MPVAHLGTSGGCYLVCAFDWGPNRGRLTMTGDICMWAWLPIPGQTAMPGMTQSWGSSTRRLEVDQQSRDVCPAHP